jgi:hypothetical protein
VLRFEIGVLKDARCNGILMLLTPHCTDECVVASRKIRSSGRHCGKRLGNAVLLTGETRAFRGQSYRPKTQ